MWIPVAGLALLLLLPGAAPAYRGLAECPDLEPRRPAEVVEPPLRACQRAMAEAGALFVGEILLAESACLDRALAGEFSGRVERFCLGLRELATGQIELPRDPVTAERIREAFVRSEATLAAAEAEFRAAVAAACDEASLARLDACGADLDALDVCLRCAGRREAIYLVDAVLEGEPRHAATRFIGWASLANPILGLEDRRLKDQALGFHRGEFFLFASQSFADDDPEAGTKPHFVFRSRDLRTWQTLPDRIHPQGGPVGSPDLSFHEGLWHLVWQNPDPLRPDNRRLFHASSRDLVHWRVAGDLHD